MLPKTAQNALNDALIHQLEILPNVSVGTVHSPVDPPILPVACSMSFNGPTHGRVEIVASREFTRLLAGKVDGLSDDDAHDKADASMKALVNKVADVLMPHIMNGSASQYRRSQPVLRSVDIECDWPNLAASRETQLFHANGHILAARLIELD